jgi:hypothetical protein
VDGATFLASLNQDPTRVSSDLASLFMLLLVLTVCAQALLEVRHEAALGSLEARRGVLSSAHPSTLTSVHNLGGLLGRQGRLVEAEALFREALAGRELALGAAHALTRQSAAAVAVFVGAREDAARAEEEAARAAVVAARVQQVRAESAARRAAREA